MTKEELLIIVKEILKISFLEKKPDYDFFQIGEHENLIELLGINSISAIETIVRIEKQLKIDFHQEDLSIKSMETLNKLVNIIKGLLDNN